MSRLGLYLFGPFNDIYVTCFGDNQPPDAVIEIKGDFSRSLKVEVTTTETEETSILAEKTYQYLKQKRPDIYGVFYCYLGQNSIDEVTADSISP
mgnify:CR=1 FL=1